MYRGSQDRNQALFKAAGDEWKKLFERAENDAAGTMGVNKELCGFAEWQCKSFQYLLKQAKEEYGGHAKYTFNFKKQKRAAKGPPAPASAVAASAAEVAACDEDGGEELPVEADDEPLPTGRTRF